MFAKPRWCQRLLQRGDDLHGHPHLREPVRPLGDRIALANTAVGRGVGRDDGELVEGDAADERAGRYPSSINRC